MKILTRLGVIATWLLLSLNGCDYKQNDIETRAFCKQGISKQNKAAKTDEELWKTLLDIRASNVNNLKLACETELWKKAIQLYNEADPERFVRIGAYAEAAKACKTDTADSYEICREPERIYSAGLAFHLKKAKENKDPDIAIYHLSNAYVLANYMKDYNQISTIDESSLWQDILKSAEKTSDPLSLYMTAEFLDQSNHPDKAKELKNIAKRRWPNYRAGWKLINNEIFIYTDKE